MYHVCEFILKLCCRVFGERVDGNIAMVNYRKFLRHFDCSCHGITNMKSGPRPLTSEQHARATTPFAFC